MTQFDWITWTVEGIGFLILCMWIVVPIREFRAIFRRVRQRPRKPIRPEAKVKEFVPRSVEADGLETPEAVSPEAPSTESVPPDFVPVES